MHTCACSILEPRHDSLRFPWHKTEREPVGDIAPCQPLSWVVSAVLCPLPRHLSSLFTYPCLMSSLWQRTDWDTFLYLCPGHPCPLLLALRIIFFIYLLWSEWICVFLYLCICAQTNVWPRGEVEWYTMVERSTFVFCVCVFLYLCICVFAADTMYGEVEW